MMLPLEFLQIVRPLPIELKRQVFVYWFQSLNLLVIGGWKLFYELRRLVSDHPEIKLYFDSSSSVTIKIYLINKITLLASVDKISICQNTQLLNSFKHCRISLIDVAGDSIALRPRFIPYIMGPTYKALRSIVDNCSLIGQFHLSMFVYVVALDIKLIQCNITSVSCFSNNVNTIVERKKCFKNRILDHITIEVSDNVNVFDTLQELSKMTKLIKLQFSASKINDSCIEFMMMNIRKVEFEFLGLFPFKLDSQIAEACLCYRRVKNLQLDFSSTSPEQLEKLFPKLKVQRLYSRSNQLVNFNLKNSFCTLLNIESNQISSCSLIGLTKLQYLRLSVMDEGEHQTVDSITLNSIPNQITSLIIRIKVHTDSLNLEKIRLPKYLQKLNLLVGQVQYFDLIKCDHLTFLELNDVNKTNGSDVLNDLPSSLESLILNIEQKEPDPVGNFVQLDSYLELNFMSPEINQKFRDVSIMLRFLVSIDLICINMEDPNNAAQNDTFERNPLQPRKWMRFNISTADKLHISVQPRRFPTIICPVELKDCLHVYDFRNRHLIDMFDMTSYGLDFVIFKTRYDKSLFPAPIKLLLSRV